MHRIIEWPSIAVTLVVLLLIVDINGYVLDDVHRSKKERNQHSAPESVKTNEDEQSKVDKAVTEKYHTDSVKKDEKESSVGLSEVFDRYFPSRYHGHFQLGPGLTFNVSSGASQGNERWWQGPNICTRIEEKETDDDDDDDDDEKEKKMDRRGRRSWNIMHHRILISHSCDDSDAAYKCTTIKSANGKTSTRTKIYECCPGYERENDQAFCTEEVELVDLISTLEHLSATEMVRALSLSGLATVIQRGNYSVFAPTNEALDKYGQKNADLNVVVVNPDVERITNGLNSVLTSHVAPGYVRVSLVEDEDLIQTETSGSKIRINKYNIHGRKSQLVTANCLPMIRTDVKATNGMVHLVDGVLQPVTSNIKQLVRANPKLSIISKVLDVIELSEDGKFTLFAPTDEAFDKLSLNIREKILSGHSCGKDVIKQHLLPFVICSSVIQGRIRARNSLNKYLRMSRGEDDDVMIESSHVMERDQMAVDGVLHIIDQVIMPSGAEDIIDVIQKTGSAQLLAMLKATGMDKTLQNMENFTLFLPNSDAVMDQKLNADPVGKDLDDLKKILSYYIVPKRLTSRELIDGAVLETAANKDTLRIKEYQSFPFSRQSHKTVQCSAILSMDLEACGGIVHVVDKVLTPPLGDVLDVIQKRKDLTELLSLVRSVGLTDILKGERPLTFFAPTNEAFKKLPQDFLGQLKNDSTKAKKVLLSHMLADALCCSGVFPSQLFMSHEANLDGWLIPVDKTDDGTVKFGSVPVSSCDHTATNGVVQVIDSFSPTVVSRYSNVNRRRANRRWFSLGDIWSVFE